MPNDFPGLFCFPWQPCPELWEVQSPYSALRLGRKG